MLICYFPILFKNRRFLHMNQNFLQLPFGSRISINFLVFFKAFFQKFGKIDFDTFQ